MDVFPACPTTDAEHRRKRGIRKTQLSPSTFRQRARRILPTLKPKSEKATVLARYELRAVETTSEQRISTAQELQRARNGAKAAEIHRTEPLPRQNGPEFLLASPNPPHEAFSAPRTRRIRSTKPLSRRRYAEIAAQRPFRARNSPNSPRRAPNAPSGRRSWRRAQRRPAAAAIGGAG